MVFSHIEYLIRQMPQLETERIILRKLVRSDAEDMYEYCSDEDTPKFLTWEPHESLKYTRDYLKFVIKKYKTGEFLDWGIVLKSNGKLIGTCGFTSIDLDHSKGEIGYVINGAYRNNGYATEAVERVLKYAFEELELNRMEARVIEGNDASIALLEKCDMTREGLFRDEMYLKGEFKNIIHYAMLRGEYFNR